jgi:hypothetical protein
LIGDEQKAEMLLQALDWANNEAIFTSVKGKKVPGRSAFVQRPLKNIVVDLAVSEEGGEGIYSMEMVPKIIDGLNTINNQIRAYRSQAGSRRKEALGQLDFASAEESLKFYQVADTETLKRALKNSRGYLFKDDFKLNKTNVKQVGSYSESALPEGQESVYIGTIHVGAANVQDVLNRVTAAINEKVFDIFNNVKVLTTNIQAYFAGGLAVDEQADTAINAAQKIETKTEEIKSEK